MYIVIAAVLEELFCFIEQGLDLPLHYASSKEIAELLISYGADPDRMDKVSQTLQYHCYLPFVSPLS